MMTTQNDDPYDEATNWFEPLYANADASGNGVPWAKMTPNPNLVQWLHGRPVGRWRALVVGSGLGDDAEYVAGHGIMTTAFDVAPSAVEIAKQRFPDSDVDYVVADLFDPPEGWRQAFNLVVEFITVQALPPHLQREAAERIASFVKPGGTLLVGSLIREPYITPKGPPWPVSRETFSVYLRAGLMEAHRHEVGVTLGISRGFLVYTR